MLENGPASAYAAFFDIDWCPADRKELCGKVLLPILGDHYCAALERGEIRLAFDAGEGSFSVNYYEHSHPIDPQTYPMILDRISLPEDDEHRQEIDGLKVARSNGCCQEAHSRDERGVRRLEVQAFASSP